MTDRDRLKELFKKALLKWENLRNDYLEEKIDDIDNFDDVIIDYLLANGVILSPCKVGTKVWLLRKDRVPDDDYRMSFHDEWVLCEVSFQLSMINQIGKTVFLTREEAEKALEGGTLCK